jgi:hypothetical protein
MALFRRTHRAGRGRATDPADRFWAWWNNVQERLALTADRPVLEPDAAARLRSLLAPRVRELHQDLSFTIGLGVRAANMLVLSGARHPALRPVTERWRQAGPVDDAIWEFHPAAPAEPDAFTSRVMVGEHEIDPGAAVALVRTDDARCRLDLSVFHPVFGSLDDLDRSRVANVMVSWALGEDESDRWIGRISSTATRPLDSVPVSMLGAVTAQLAERWGGERWSMLEGSFGNRRLIAAIRHPLHRVDHPLFDEHIAVRLPYADAMPDGLPTERALVDLLAFEESLTARLREHALLVAQQTTSGERLLHFYADSTDSPVAVVRELLGGYLGPLAGVDTQYDPGWEAIEHLRA